MWSGTDMTSFFCENEAHLWHKNKWKFRFCKWWVSQCISLCILGDLCADNLTKCQQQIKTSICIWHRGTFSFHSSIHLCYTAWIKSHTYKASNTYLKHITCIILSQNMTKYVFCINIEVIFIKITHILMASVHILRQWGYISMCTAGLIFSYFLTASQ